MAPNRCEACGQSFWRPGAYCFGSQPGACHVDPAGSFCRIRRCRGMLGRSIRAGEFPRKDASVIRPVGLFAPAQQPGQLGHSDPKCHRRAGCFCSVLHSRPCGAGPMARAGVARRRSSRRCGDGCSRLAEIDRPRPGSRQRALIGRGNLGKDTGCDGYLSCKAGWMAE